MVYKLNLITFQIGMAFDNLDQGGLMDLPTWLNAPFKQAKAMSIISPLLVREALSFGMLTFHG